MACCVRIALRSLTVGVLAVSSAEIRRTRKRPAGRRSPVNYARDVRPILSDNCFACHGPDDHKRKAGLRFDTKDGAFSQARERQHRDRARQAGRERAHRPDRERRPGSAHAAQEERQAIDRRADRDSSPLGRAGGQDLDALGVRGAGEARSARRQECELAQERRSTASSWRGSKPRGSRPRPRPRRRPDPPRDTRPDRSSADPRGGRRVPGRSIAGGL